LPVDRGVEPGFAEAAGLPLKNAQQARDTEMFLTNIRYAEQEGRLLSYSLNNNHNYSRMTAHRARNITRMLDAAGLAKNHPAPQGRLGKQSQIEATPTLIALWAELNPAVVYDKRCEAIICRSRKDPDHLLEIRHAPDKIRQMHRFNEMQGANVIGMEATGAIRGMNGIWIFEREKVKWGRTFRVQQRLRLDAKPWTKVHTSDQWHHGRVYGPAQNIPGDVRHLITLNGERVIELDFKALHPTLAYVLCGAQIDADPYEGVPGFKKEQTKPALLTMLNARTREGAIAALMDGREGDPVCRTKAEAERLYDAVEARHPLLAEKGMFGSDAGMKLMNLDGRIILAAADYLMDRGISCITVHDSIIVAARFEGVAREALEQGWRSQNLLRSACLPAITCTFLLQYGGALAPVGPGSGSGVGGFSGVVVGLCFLCWLALRLSDELRSYGPNPRGLKRI
jgi:hypothetical protein